MALLSSAARPTIACSLLRCGSARRAPAARLVATRAARRAPLRVACSADEPAASPPPSDAAAPAPPPPPPRPAAPAPPTSGVRLVRVETRDAAWAGVAARDSGEDSTATAKRLATLFAGDVAALLLFAAIGRSNHGEGGFPLEVIGTAVPFVLGWLLAAPLLGGFGDAARGRDVGAAAGAAAKAWAGAAPAGLALRALSQGGRAPPLPFVLVAVLAGGALLVAWRAAAAATAPAVDKSVAARKSRQGNPLEFFQLLTGLVKRW